MVKFIYFKIHLSNFPDKNVMTAQFGYGEHLVLISDIMLHFHSFFKQRIDTVTAFPCKSTVCDTFCTFND